MAFERNLVYSSYKIKTPKVLILKDPNLSGWCGIFISLRTETSLKWLYMSRCWRKSGMRLCNKHLSFQNLFFNRNKYVSKLKNLGLINKSFMSSYQLKPGGSTNKFTYRSFSVKPNLKTRYMQFERKCAREVTTDCQSVELLIEKIKNNDAFLMHQYTNPKLQPNIFNKQNLEKIESILGEYNLIVTKLLIINLNRLGKRIYQQNLPNDSARLQCLLIESFSVAIYAINSIKTASAGSDSIRFKSKAEFLNDLHKKRLIKTKYFFSTKSIKVKKDLPKIVRDNIVEDSKLAKQLATEYNLKLQLELIKKVNIKSIRKNCKPTSIKRIWIPKSNNKAIPIGIPSLRDRVLQKIILFAILPIVEYQSDSNSFGFRENRTPHQAVSIVANSFIRFSKINQPTKRSSYKQVSAETYKKSTDHKFTIRGGNIGGLRKSKRQYRKFYYVSFPKSNESKRKQYTPYLKYLSVHTVGCFGNISHKAILELTPIASKYLFLLKA
jgi:hypothetical protein